MVPANAGATLVEVLKRLKDFDKHKIVVVHPHKEHLNIVFSDCLSHSALYGLHTVKHAWSHSWSHCGLISSGLWVQFLPLGL